ncbi:HBR148Wp [Eremothecium sinecaudum]|uniref:HBR148Wp n=1 Tax=Eremothecium sinecaudum TaxID=45286 RepID=A0A120K161_9SACH|nr:HBR148Wp [Eremothecium sinecaudum]AMD19049.1 HBR148Wp [Eremothecium sinecaudum]
MPPSAANTPSAHEKCTTCGTVLKHTTCGNSQEDYYNTEIYPPILEHAVNHDLPAAKIYGVHTPYPELIQDINDDHLKSLVEEWVSKFNAVLQDIKAGLDKRHVDAKFDGLFANHVAWRDHLALGWNFHTFNGLKALKKRVIPRLYTVKIEDIVLDDLADYRYKLGFGKVVMHEKTAEHPSIEWIQIYYNFVNKIGSGKGVGRLAAVKDPVTGAGKLMCFTLYTVLEDLKASPEKVLRNRPEGVDHGPHKDRQSWLEVRERETTFTETHQPTVLIVGGGQGGLSLAARLKSFGINSLIVEKNHKVGDNWRNRYKFLVLHDPVWYDEMPYINFPPTWPVYTPKDKLGDWFDSYAKSLDLNIQCDTTAVGASFDDVTRRWKVEVRNNLTGAINFFRPSHLVMATGHSGEPRIPHFEGQEHFQGKIVHSSQHGSGAQYKGGKALVVGGCNSAHDICQDFYEQGVDVTMLQRSSTCIITSTHGTVINNKDLYDEDGPKTETADRIFHSMPIHLMNGVMQQQFRSSCIQDKQLLDSLNEVGFKTNAGFGGTGVFGLYFRVGSGYYIDVGCSPLIVEKKVKLKHGVGIKRFLKTGVEFTDGTKLEGLDVVVLATGYTNMKETARRLFGNKVADRLNPVWGLDKEGEIQTMWRDSGHPNFWFMGGNLALARYYSKRLALKIVAQEKDIFY